MKYFRTIKNTVILFLLGVSFFTGFLFYHYYYWEYCEKCQVHVPLKTPLSEVWHHGTEGSSINYNNRIKFFINIDIRDELVSIAREHNADKELKSFILDKDVFKQMHALSAYYLIDKEDALLLSIYLMGSDNVSVRAQAIYEVAAYFPESPIKSHTTNPYLTNLETSILLRDSLLVWYLNREAGEEKGAGVPSKNSADEE